eukprot:2773159-Rhodomonas_salina.1
MEPPQNTETATGEGPLPTTETLDTGHPFEGGPEAGAAHGAVAPHGTEIVPETEPAHEGEDTGPTHGAGPAHAIEATPEVAEEAGLTPGEVSAEHAFYTMAADLQRTLDEIEMERRAPSPVPDRRSEMTPARVVHFEPAAMTPDRR